MLHTMLVMASPRMVNQLTRFIGAILMLSNSSNFKTPALDKPLHKMLHKTLDKTKTMIQASFRKRLVARERLAPRQEFILFSLGLNHHLPSFFSLFGEGILCVRLIRRKRKYLKKRGFIEKYTRWICSRWSIVTSP
jgi:hypothetical protein